MARQCSHWIQSYIQYMGKAEAPEIFHKWVGISVLAGSLQKKVGFYHQQYRIFPNHYIVLVGPPAVGKTTACSKGLEFLDKLPNIVFSSQSATRESMAQQLKDSFQGIPLDKPSLPPKYKKLSSNDINDPDLTHKFFVYSALMAFINEFSTLIASDPRNMVSFLTDLYDYQRQIWLHKTRNHGEEMVIEPCLNLLTTTQPKKLIETLPTSAIDGGFVSRTIFVASEESREVDPFGEIEAWEVELKTKLEADLKEINKLMGQYQLTKGAMDIYRAWWASRRADIVDEQMEGYFERKKTHIIKLAMVLSAAKRDELTIDTEEVEEAIEWLNEVEPNMISVFASVGENKLSAHLERISRQLQKHRRIPHSTLLETNYRYVDDKEFDSIIDVLFRTGRIGIENDNMGRKKTVYWKD